MNFSKDPCIFEQDIGGTTLKLSFSYNCQLCSSPAELSEVKWSDTGPNDIECDHHVQLSLILPDNTDGAWDDGLWNGNDTDEDTCFRFPQLR